MKRLLLILTFVISVAAGLRASVAEGGAAAEQAVTSELKATEDAAEKEIGRATRSEGDDF